MKSIISDFLENIWINRSVTLFFCALAMFFLWVSCLWLVKHVLISKLEKWTSKTDRRWDDVIVKSIHVPMIFLILGTGLAFVSLYLPLPSEMKQISALVFQISIVIAAVLFTNRIFKGFIDANVSLPIFAKFSAGVVKGLIQAFIWGTGILVVLDLTGISITPILASLGIGSLAIALALQDTLANFFSGIYMAIDQPVKKGDFVKLESGEQGYVLDIGWRSTRIRTLPNDVVIVPNAKLIGSVITNFYQPDQEVAVLVEVGVHYNSDLKHAERVVQEVGKNIMLTVPGGVPDFEPFVRYHTFGESSINFTVILRAKEFVDNYLIKHEFIKRLHERFQKEKITIPFPIRTIEISQTASEDLKPLSSKT